MNLTSALDKFLHSFYESFTPPATAASGLSGSAFYDLIIAPAVKSPEFRRRLLQEPQQVLAEAGIELPEGVKVRFVENTKTLVHIVIPPYIGD